MMSGIHSTNSNIPTTSGLTQTQSFILSAVSPGPTGRPVRPVDWRTDTPRPPGRRRSINHSRDGGLNPFRVRAAQISRFANRNRRHSGHPYTCLSEVEFPIRLLPPFGSVALYACTTICGMAVPAPRPSREPLLLARWAQSIMALFSGRPCLRWRAASLICCKPARVRNVGATHVCRIHSENPSLDILDRGILRGHTPRQTRRNAEGGESGRK